MKDNENLSVDEILREADKMLRQIDKKSTNESIKADKDIEEIKTFTPVKSNKQEQLRPKNLFRSIADHPYPQRKPIYFLS